MIAEKELPRKFFLIKKKFLIYVRNGEGKMLNNTRILKKKSRTSKISDAWYIL